MKNKTIIIASLLATTVFTANAQDKIIKLSDDTIKCTITETTGEEIKFKYVGEDVINSIYTNTIQNILFASGRSQSYNQRVIIKDATDWEKVQLTSLESDIKGLVKGEEMMAKASSGWSTTGQGKMQKKAMDKLKKLAATKGYHIVLLITTTSKGGHYGISGGTKASVSGVGYKY